MLLGYRATVKLPINRVVYQKRFDIYLILTNSKEQTPWFQRLRTTPSNNRRPLGLPASLGLTQPPGPPSILGRIGCSLGPCFATYIAKSPLVMTHPAIENGDL